VVLREELLLVVVLPEEEGDQRRAEQGGMNAQVWPASLASNLTLLCIRDRTVAP